jgi:probable phosphoglycerate mutase
LTPKKIILLRHGQTDFNLRGIVQGSGVDSSLNDTGRAQAQAFYESYHNFGFDKLYTSALKRTHETVQGFISTGLSWDILADINEISWGNHEGQPITPDEDKYYHWMLQQWQSGETDLKIVGGESPDEVAVRLRKSLDIILNSPHQTILVCMHGRAMRVMLCLMLNYPLKSMDAFEHKNACVYELQFTGTMFHVLKHNDVSHLKHLNGSAINEIQVTEPVKIKS